MLGGGRRAGSEERRRVRACAREFGGRNAVRFRAREPGTTRTTKGTQRALSNGIQRRFLLLPAGPRPVCLQWTARRRRRSVRDPGSSMALARPVHSSRRYWYGTVAACVPMARLVTRPPWPTLPFAALHASLAGLLCRRTRRNPAQMSGMVLVGSIRPLCKKMPLAARPTWGEGCC